jgi:hypothetical protein
LKAGADDFSLLQHKNQVEAFFAPNVPTRPFSIPQKLKHNDAIHACHIFCGQRPAASHVCGQVRIAAAALWLSITSSTPATYIKGYS